MDQAKSVVAKPVTPVPLQPTGPRMVTPPAFTRKVQAGIATTQPAGTARPIVIPGKSEVIQEAPPAQAEAATEAQPQPQGKVYRFAKLMGVAEVIRFEDGETFTFPLIRRNNMPGYSPTSSVETEDEVLANNLRKAAKKNNSIREVK